MHILRRYNGFSLVEVMVAAIIFSIAVVGIYASLHNVKKQSQDVSDKGLIGALCGQKFLEDRRAAVDMRDWASGGQLAPGTYTSTPDPYCTVNGIAYTITYTIENDATGFARKATVTVTWPDA